MLSIQKVLKNTRAAIDLASIMVGIIVIGIVGAIIAATVFAVIPWAQDKAAASVMDSIETAETAYYGFSADPDSELEEGFTDKQGLIAFVEQGNNSEGLLPESNLYDVRAGVSTSGSAACWGAVVFSDSGKYYYSSSTSSTGAFSDTFLAAQQAVQTRCDVTLQQPSPDPVADNCEAPFNTSDVFSDVVDESGINCGLDTPVYLTNGGVSSSVGNVAATVSEDSTVYSIHVLSTPTDDAWGNAATSQPYIACVYWAPNYTSGNAHEYSTNVLFYAQQNFNQSCAKTSTNPFDFSSVALQAVVLHTGKVVGAESEVRVLWTAAQ